MSDRYPDVDPTHIGLTSLIRFTTKTRVLKLLRAIAGNEVLLQTSPTNSQSSFFNSVFIVSQPPYNTKQPTDELKTFTEKEPKLITDEESKPSTQEKHKMGDELDHHLSGQTRINWLSSLNTEFAPRRNYRRTSIIGTIGS